MRKDSHLKTRHTYLLIAILSLVAFSCSTQKDKVLNRTYHRTTAKFNGYFNGKESLKEAVIKLEKNHQEDYNTLLPTTILGDQKQAQKIFPQLNRTIDKAALVVEYHSMEIKGVEKNKWIDDSYFLMGKALFYKQEYGKAIEMFGYISREYEGYITDMAILWSTRAYIEMENFASAEKQLLYLESDARLKREDKALLAEVNANYHIKKENWEDVIAYLSTAIKYSQDKSKKTRLTFIIAQLYQIQEDYETAYDYFDKVVKMNPEYEFLFNALLSRARAFNPKYNDSSKLISEITKMLKDDKNIDYKDQIYYALAEISLKEGARDQAIEHLLNSTANNSGNDQQQSVSHLALADLYFDDSAYLSAQVHYDTAMTFLSQNHPDYEMLSKKRNSLNELVELYSTINLQDSLLTLSTMSEEDLNALIDAIIEEKKEEDRLAKEALKANSGSISSSNSRNQFNPMSGGGGAWYFYNPSAISFGYSEFITKWGERRLEDNWRRKNKNQIIIDEEDEDGEDKDIYSRDYYLDIIPFSDSAKASTVDIIVQSFYQLGLIYKEDLKDYDEAINAFETLVEAYPKNNYEALSYYQLYSSHLLIEENLSAEQYIQRLMKEYPNSDYLKMILDPEGYYSSNKEEVDSAMIYYEVVYIAFSQQNYVEVILQDSLLSIKHSDHPIAEQLFLLKALSMGHLYGEESLIENLNALLAVYYTGEVADEARAILQDIERRSIIPEETSFTFDLKEEHYYVLAMESGGPSVNKVKIEISNFNSLFYKLNAYKTQSLMLNLDYQLIIVKAFDREKSATSYLQAIQELQELKELMGRSEYEHFIISSSNFKTLYKEKSLDKYLVYYEGKYLKYK